jgi:predicted transcriptional regulator
VSPIVGKNQVTGLIIPLDGVRIDRVFHHRPVIAMFVERFPSDIEVGDRAYLYEAGGSRTLEGEGTIVAIGEEIAQDVPPRYGRELSFSIPELDEYVATSGKKNTDAMLILKVQDAIKYTRPLRCGLAISRDGTYMNQAVHSKILSENT